MRKNQFFFLVVLVFTFFAYPQTQEELNSHLFEAVKAGNLEQVKILVEKGADVNARDQNKTAALFYAISSGYKNIEMFLVDKGAVLSDRETKKAASKFWELQGDGSYNKSNYHEAIDFYKKSLKIIKELGDKTAKAFMLNNIGMAYFELKQYEKALEYFREIVNLEPEEFVYLENLCATLVRLERFGEVEILLKKCFGKFKDIEAQGKIYRGLAAIYFLWGEYHEKQKHYQDALDNYKKAYEIVKKYNPQSIGEVLNKIALAYENLAQYEKAINYYQRARMFFQKAGNHAIEAEALVNLGLMSYAASQYNQARAYLEKALGIFRKIRDKEGEASALCVLGYIYLFGLTEYPRAIDYLEKSLTIFRKLGKRKDEAFVMILLGFSQRLIGKYELSITYSKNALAIFGENNDQTEKAYALLNIGLVYLYTGQYKKAIDLYNQALKVSQKKGDHFMEALLLNNLAYTFILMGRYEKAIRYLEQARKKRKNVDGQFETVFFLNNLGVVYLCLGQLKKAGEYLEQSLEKIRSSGGGAVEVDILANLGLLKVAQGRQHQAVDHFKKVFKKNQKRGELNKIAALLNALGDLYRNLGQIQKAENYYNQSLSISRDIGDPLLESTVLSSIGNFYFCQHLYERSIPYYKNAIKLTENVNSTDSTALIRLQLAYSYIKIGKKDDAIKEFELALSVKNKIRFALSEEDSKLSFFESYRGAYRELFWLYWDNYSDKKAFEAAENSKIVVFADMMAERGIRKKIAAQRPELKKLLEEETVLLNQRNRLITAINKSKDEARTTAGEKLRSIEQKIFNLRKKVEKTFPRYKELLYPVTTSLKPIQKLLKEDETYISYILFQEDTVVFILTKNNLISVKLSVGKQWIEEKVSNIQASLNAALPALNYVKPNYDKNGTYRAKRRKFSKQFASYSQYIVESNRLYQKIFEPLETFLNTKNLIVSADGVLYGLPLEVLAIEVPVSFEYLGKKYSLEEMALGELKGEIPLFQEFRQLQYVGSRYHIAYIPTASALNVLRGDEILKDEKTEGVVAFADPVFSLTDERVPKKHLKKQIVLIDPLPQRLKDSKAEAMAFKDEIGKGKIYTGMDAVERNIWRAHVQKAKYLLFSTHGFLGMEQNVKGIEEPYLVMTLVEDSIDYDGIFTMSEAAGLRLNCDIVILSACDSAGKSGKGGEGFAGMARSFLFAGSQAVVASHWSVEVNATKMLMENYGKFLKTRGRLEALEAARKVVKNAVVEYGKERKIKVSYAHPYFWGAFVLLGES